MNTIDWRNIPPYNYLQLWTAFEVVIKGWYEEYSLPVIRLPEEVLSPALRDQRVAIYALLGFMAMPGNIKRVPAGYMVERAVNEKLLKSMQPLVEPTSGNMGVALAYEARKFGIPVIAMVSDSLPPGKMHPLLTQGAQVVKESEALAFLKLEKLPGTVELAKLYAEAVGGFFLNQYSNPWNPESYYKLVAPQLWKGVGGAAMYVSAVGSCGTFLGLGRYFREQEPQITLVATMPYVGMNIDGIRDPWRLREITHPWMELDPIIEQIDEGAARRYSEKLTDKRIPAGPSSGAAFGTTEHLLLDHLGKGKLEDLRGPSGEVRVITTFADSCYPYV